ncbi:hypothetical protein, partial [Vibrio mexicanus]|uniref:hypothetical protein n=1 Tax=Vibrio mexicanus TaxID=1004326 RepID=UPI000A57F748
IYVGEHNYYVMAPSEVSEYKGTFDYQEKLFPRYYIYRANEWPREDLSDASSYDLPRIQFYWANMSDESHPMYTDYEGQVKVWSMKTDGTDLRLVLDEFPAPTASGSGKMVRSPNMRYLAFGFSGSGKAVYDLQTGETHRLDYRGPIGFLWAEDSSYLYYRVHDERGHSTHKWDAETHEKTQVDVVINDTSLIIDGIRTTVDFGGVGVENEETNEELKVLIWHEGLTYESARSEYRSLSLKGNTPGRLQRSTDSLSM